MLLQDNFVLSNTQSQNKNEATDIQYWQNFVDTFYAPTGVLRQNLHDAHTGHSKQFEISNPALARFYYTQFTTGIRQIQMVIEGAHENPVNTPGAHLVESRLSLIYWFFNDTQVCDIISVDLSSPILIMKPGIYPRTLACSIRYEHQNRVDANRGSRPLRITSPRRYSITGAGRAQAKPQSQQSCRQTWTKAIACP